MKRFRKSAGLEALLELARSEETSRTTALLTLLTRGVAEGWKIADASDADDKELLLLHARLVRSPNLCRPLLQRTRSRKWREHRVEIFRFLARHHHASGIAGLRKLARNRRERPSARLRAARILLQFERDREWADLGIEALRSFDDDEVQIALIELRDILSGVSRSLSGTAVFQEWTTCLEELSRRSDDIADETGDELRRLRKAGLLRFGSRHRSAS